MLCFVMPGFSVLHFFPAKDLFTAYNTFKYSPWRCFSMDEEILRQYQQAGKIAKEALLFGKDLIRKGAKLIDVTEKIEAKILQLGALSAFPVQISCDAIAAHYCAFKDDPIVF